MNQPLPLQHYEAGKINRMYTAHTLIVSFLPVLKVFTSIIPSRTFHRAHDQESYLSLAQYL